MVRLNKEWLTEPHIDFEYKKYLVLAYLQDMQRYFMQNKIYPYLDQLCQHFEQLEIIRKSKKNKMDAFPKELKAIDIKKQRLLYASSYQDDELLEEMNTILSFAHRKMGEHIREAEEIKSVLLENIHLEPVGVMPIRRNEGYIILYTGKEIRCYYYRIKLIQQGKEPVPYKQVLTRFLLAKPKKRLMQLESIKNELIKMNPELPVPAVYFVESQHRVPFVETLIPLTKFKIFEKE